LKVVLSFCTALLLASPVRAQEPGGGTPDSSMFAPVGYYRNPQRALVLGILIPGAGHIYAGEYLRGFLAYEATVGGIGGGILIFLLDNCTFTVGLSTTCKPGPEWPHQVLGIAGVGMGIWEWISSARDAPRAAERANARHGTRSPTITPIIDPLSGAANVSRIGVSVHW
jgi:hypothetical protein